MNAIVEKALDLWGLSGAAYELVAARENAVFRVTYDGSTVALRLHRKGYRTDQELQSELHWMAAVAKGGISVPSPVPATSGAMLQVVDGVQVDVLSWLNGVSVDEALATLDPAGRVGLFHEIGRQMAHLHEISDAWSPPEGFVRCEWNRAGLLGETPLWDRFWDNPQLSTDEKRLFLDMREAADAELAQIEGSLDYGLIHADLVSVNIMVDDGQVQMIDFDDGGFGFRQFEIATGLFKHMGEADFPALKAALIQGYTSARAIDLAALDLFFLLRAATYVGWNISRMAEEGAIKRNELYISTTRKLAFDYLAR